jgi:hypothetical protein
VYITQEATETQKTSKAKQTTMIVSQLASESIRNINEIEDSNKNRNEVMSDSDFGVKSATIQVYGNNNNSQSDHWIGLKCFVHSPDMFSYYGLNF